MALNNWPDDAEDEDSTSEASNGILIYQGEAHSR